MADEPTRAAKLSGRGHDLRSRRGTFERFPTAVPEAFRFLGSASTSQAKEPFCEKQIEGHCEIYDQSEDLQDGDVMDDLDDLKGDEDGRSDKREVFRPPLCEPEADHLGGFQSGIDEHEDCNLVEVRGSDPEEMPQPAESAGSGSANRSASTALKIVKDHQVIPAQRRLVACEQEDDHRQTDQDRNMDPSVDCDSPQHVAIPEGTSAEGELDLVSVRGMFAGRLVWRREWEPGVASQASVPAQASRFSGEEGVFLAQVPRVGAHQLMAVEAATNQLVPELRTEALGSLGAGRVLSWSSHGLCLPDGNSHIRPV